MYNQVMLLEGGVWREASWETYNNYNKYKLMYDITAVMVLKKVKPYESILNVCMARPPMTLTHTIIHDNKPDEVKSYGRITTHCNFCGKEWENHK